jgi:hypothetical protein
LVFAGLAEEFEGVEFGEVEFEEGDVGETLEDHAESGGSVGALFDDFDIGVALAERDETFPQELLGLSDEYANYFSF